MIRFEDLEVGDRFMYSLLYYKKTSPIQASLISDEKFEQGRAKFIPSFGLDCSFKKSIKVQPVDGDLLVDKYISNGIFRQRDDWPVGKHPG